VANSTVLGGSAGEHMAEWLRHNDSFRDADQDAMAEAMQQTRLPLNRPAADLEPIRERLYDIMWQDVGVIRSAEGLGRAQAALALLDEELEASGVPRSTLAFNLTWHDWLNLKNLILVSRAITTAAVARQESRGAHYRSDFPRSGDLMSSAFTRVRLVDDDLMVDTEAVRFTRVKPGETLLKQAG